MEQDENIEKAVHLSEHVVETHSLMYTESDRRCLASEFELITTYLKRGTRTDLDKAIQVLEHVIGIETSARAPTDEDLLFSKYILAWAYLQANRHIDKAVKLLEHVVDVHANDEVRLKSLELLVYPQTVRIEKLKQALSLE